MSYHVLPLSLKRAGLFDEDSNYSGKIGIAALEMIKQFSSEGHSEQSAGLCLSIFERLARFKPLSPIENPMIDGSFVDHIIIPLYKIQLCGNGNS